MSFSESGESVVDSWRKPYKVIIAHIDIQIHNLPVTVSFN